MATTLAIGTDKGLFRVTMTSRGWALGEPELLGWRVTALATTGAGTRLAATGSGWFGPAVQRLDGGKWQQASDIPRLPDHLDRKVEQLWRFHQAPEALYLGVADAGLFRSEDDGITWTPVDGLNDHESAPAWVPGAGGLCAHAVLHHPTNTRRRWCGISAVGVFRTDDGGRSWALKNHGVQVSDPGVGHDTGYCVHALVLDPDDPERIYRQDHQGMYRSTDGADTWQLTNDGLPSRFGFPLVMDHSTRHLFCVPQASDEHRIPAGGLLRVYRSNDGADSWHDASNGLPSRAGYAGVLRGAMATDHEGIVAFGTTSGGVFVSTDSGDLWTEIPGTLPRIFAVDCWVD